MQDSNGDWWDDEGASQDGPNGCIFTYDARVALPLQAWQIVVPYEGIDFSPNYILPQSGPTS